ncbi:hypothetical protein HPP92_005280 [Vanilla planifolia]|uniref:Uncharacterized protein n=1 Tax=Vanilla planifolia TaxID=51239 RepID=A0A835RLE2_VANPL|nr:hypothetical protein HPP92_005280 [Vanilla planifolia]
MKGIPAFSIMGLDDKISEVLKRELAKELRKIYEDEVAGPMEPKDGGGCT